MRKSQMTRLTSGFSSEIIGPGVDPDDPDVMQTIDGPIFRGKKGKYIGKWIMMSDQEPVDFKIDPMMRPCLVSTGTIENNKFIVNKCV